MAKQRSGAMSAIAIFGAILYEVTVLIDGIY